MFQIDSKMRAQIWFYRKTFFNKSIGKQSKYYTSCLVWIVETVWSNYFFKRENLFYVNMKRIYTMTNRCCFIYTIQRAVCYAFNTWKCIQDHFRQTFDYAIIVYLFDGIIIFCIQILLATGTCIFLCYTKNSNKIIF